MPSPPRYAQTYGPPADAKPENAKSHLYCHVRANPAPFTKILSIQTMPSDARYAQTYAAPEISAETKLEKPGPFVQVAADTITRTPTANASANHILRDLMPLSPN